MRDLTDRRQALLVLACACALLLSACASGVDSLRPAATIRDIRDLSPGRDIAGSARPGSTGVDREWWTVWGDPQLDQLLASDALTAPTIEQASARLRRAAANLDVVVADRSPRIDASAEAMGERFPDHYVYPAPYAGNWGSEGALLVSAGYTLDFWGRQREAQAAASSRVDATDAEAEDACLLLRTAVVDAYVRLDSAYRLRDVANDGLARRQGVLALLATRERAGLASSVETIQAREAITGTRDEIARLDGEIAHHRHRIAALLGRDPTFADALLRPSLEAIADPAPLSAIPAELLGARPDVAAARASAEAAAHDIGVARAAFYPNVNLTAFAGVQSLGLSSLLRSGSIAAGTGPAVTLPIFDAGSLRANLRGKVSDYDAAVALYDAALNRALSDVADGITDLSANRARQSEAYAAVAHWSHILDLQALREHQGLSGAMERLSVETALLLAKRRAAESDGRVVIAQVALIRALGGAWSPSSSDNSGQPK